MLYFALKYIILVLKRITSNFIKKTAYFQRFLEK